MNFNIPTNNIKKIDLHIHTQNSDGFYSTQQILSRAEELGLSIISITDHDSVQSYFDIKKQNLHFDGQIVTGVELSFAHKGRLFDILGYGINLKEISDWLNSYYKKHEIFKVQNYILKKMQLLYSTLGIKFDKNLKILKEKKSEAYNLMKSSVMSIEENKSVAPEFWKENFFKKHHTNPKSKFFVDETIFAPSIKEVIDIIHKSNGIASLAHCGAYGMSEEDIYNLLDFAVQNGVDALELKHSSHTQQVEDIVKQFAKKHNLLLTGGSDFHGGRIKPNVKLGKVYNEQFIEAKQVQNFFNKVEFLS